MNGIRLKARAKINLGLDVTGCREDGYHEVRMIMQSIGIYDGLYMRRTNNKGEINIKTNLSYLPVNENNLIYKAIKLMMNTYDINGGVDVELEKFIPVAAGMAGGSSDAAAAMVGVNRLFDMKISMNELMQLSVKVGADVPFCIMRGTVLAEGIGEILTPLKKAPSMNIVIAKPPVGVSTKLVYDKFDLLDLKEVTHPDIDGIIKAIDDGDIYGIAGKLGNVLESVTVKEYPVIEEIKKNMINMGALNSLMSGSGPTVFGIFDDAKKARECVEVLRRQKDARQVYLTNVF